MTKNIWTLGFPAPNPETEGINIKLFLHCCFNNLYSSEKAFH